jgi:hypothetical protein
MRGEHVQQQRPTLDVVADPVLQQHRAGVVDQGDVVMVVGPVDPAEPSRSRRTLSSLFTFASGRRQVVEPSQGTPAL